MYNVQYMFVEVLCWVIVIASMYMYIRSCNSCIHQNNDKMSGIIIILSNVGIYNLQE